MSLSVSRNMVFSYKDTKISRNFVRGDAFFLSPVRSAYSAQILNGTDYDAALRCLPKIDPEQRKKIFAQLCQAHILRKSTAGNEIVLSMRAGFSDSDMNIGIIKSSDPEMGFKAEIFTKKTPEVAVLSTIYSKTIKGLIKEYYDQIDWKSKYFNQYLVPFWLEEASVDKATEEKRD